MRFVATFLALTLVSAAAYAQDCSDQTNCTPETATQRAELTERQRADNIFFLGGGSALDRAARDQLDQVAAALGARGNSEICLRLVGHADSDGAPSANLKLSVARALSVSDYLSRKNILVAEVAGVGSKLPLAGFDASASENRRVTLMARKCS